MTAAMTTTASADELHVAFRIGDATYAVPARDVLQMETYQGATPVPGTSPWIAGLVQVRGRVVPAVDLRRRFGLAPAPRTLDTRIVLVQRGPRVVALIVDRAREVTRVPADAIQPNPAAGSEREPGPVRGVAHVGERLLMLLDLDALLAQELLDGRQDELR